MRRPPRQGRHHPPRNGSCKFAEEHSVPEGRPKSAQAPIRRPPYSAEARTCQSATTKAAFSFGPCTARFLFLKTEKKMGGASPLDKPPAGAEAPERGPSPSKRECLRRAAVLPPEAPAALTPPSVPFPSWPAAHPDACSCRPSASAGPSPPASDHPR